LAELHTDRTPLEAVAPPASGPTVTYVGGANIGKPYPPNPSSPKPKPLAPIVDATTVAAPAAAAAPTPAPDVPPASVAASAGDATYSTADAFDAFGSPFDTTALALGASDEGAFFDSAETMNDFVQSQILEAQRLTQQAILESFAMTLRGMGNQTDAGAPMLVSRPVQRVFAPVAAPAEVVMSPVAAPVMAAAPVAPAPAPVVAAPAPVVVAAPAPAPAPAPVVAAPAPAPVAAAPVPAPAAAPAAGGDTAAVVLGVIADKTGYPVDALAPEMELEADLGIDSIKRVEILAALSDKVPGLDPKSADPAKIRRVQDLLELLEGPPVGPGAPLAR